MLKKIKWATLMLGCSSLTAFAWDEVYFSPEHQNSGGTGLTWAQGINAIFINPANLSENKDIFQGAAIASPNLVVGRDTTQIAKKIIQKQNRFEIIANHQDNPQYVSASNVTGIAFRRVGLGLIYKNEHSAYVGYSSSRETSTLKYESNEWSGVYFSLSRDFFSNYLQLGLTTRILKKKQSSVEYTYSEVYQHIANQTYKDALKSNTKQGLAPGVDLGATLLLSDKNNRPTIAVVGRNLGSKFQNQNPADRPDPIPTQLDAGLSIEPGTKNSSAKLSADFLDTLNDTKTPYYKRLKLGAQLSFMSVLGLAGGVSDGYPSYGGFVNLKIVKVEAGTYSEELGKKAGELRGRRYYGKVSVGWSK
jgi:hypothetical protein